jgi:hypothetical protein
MATPQMSVTISSQPIGVQTPPVQPNPVPLPHGRFQIISTVVIFGLMLWVAGHKMGAKAPAFLRPQRAFLICLVLLTAYVALIGIWRAKRPSGILISERNLMSLARFQMVAWTIVVFSGFFVVVMQRIAHNVAVTEALSPDVIDPTLWAAMGISLASLVGTPWILSQKKDADPTQKAVNAAAVALKGTDTAQTINQNRQGVLYRNSDPSEARFSDIFEGDEVANTAYVDIAKLQMFILTVLLVCTYAADLWSFLGQFDLISNPQGATASTLLSMPKLSGNQISLLLISHAGYLSSKAITHTQTDNSAAASGANAGN